MINIVRTKRMNWSNSLLFWTIYFEVLFYFLYLLQYYGVYITG